MEKTQENRQWLCGDYGISVCYTPGVNIDMSIINNCMYKNYRKTITQNDLDNVMLDIFYIIIVKAFEGEKNYSLCWENQEKVLGLYIQVMFEGFFGLRQSIELEEISLPCETVIEEINLKLTEEVEQLKNRVRVLEDQVDELKKVNVALNGNGTFLTFKNDDLVLDFTKLFGHCTLISQLHQFTNATKIIIPNNIEENCHADIMQYLNFGTNLLISVTELVIIFRIRNNNRRDIPIKFRSLPNLKKISFLNYKNTVLETFDLIANTPNLTHLKYLDCSNIVSLENINSHCRTKNISLEIG